MGGRVHLVPQCKVVGEKGGKNCKCFKKKEAVEFRGHRRAAKGPVTATPVAPPTRQSLPVGPPLVASQGPQARLSKSFELSHDATGQAGCAIPSVEQLVAMLQEVVQSHQIRPAQPLVAPTLTGHCALEG